ncbi:unnamed protein product, partial [Durusdinium trenchii]
QNVPSQKCSLVARCPRMVRPRFRSHPTVRTPHGGRWDTMGLQSGMTATATARGFIYGDAAAPHGSCTVRVDALELFSANLARLSWGPSSDGTWACGADDGGNSSHLSLLPAAPLAVGPLEVSSGSQGREFHLQALAGTAFSVQTCLCPGYDAGNGLVCDQPEDFVQLLGKAIFFQSRSCSDGLCTSEYVDGVAASSAFTLRVDCGGLGLCSTAGSRLKIIDANPLSNDLPSWHQSAGCRLALQSSSHWRSGSSDLSSSDGRNVGQR